jgi:hypothetical protein
LLKVAATGAATGKSKGYARIIDTVIFRYFQQLRQMEKTQNVEKWVKLYTPWKKISLNTKALLQRFRARNLQRRLQLSERRDPGAVPRRGEFIEW